MDGGQGNIPTTMDHSQWGGTEERSDGGIDVKNCVKIIEIKYSVSNTHEI